MQVIKKQGRPGNESSPHLAELSLDVQVLSLLPRSVELDAVRVRGKGLMLLHFIQLLPPVIQMSGGKITHVAKHSLVPRPPVWGSGNETAKYYVRGYSCSEIQNLHCDGSMYESLSVLKCPFGWSFGWLTDRWKQPIPNPTTTHTHTCRIIRSLFHCIPYGISTLTDTPLPFSTVDCGILWYTDIVVYYDNVLYMIYCGAL